MNRLIKTLKRYYLTYLGFSEKAALMLIDRKGFSAKGNKYNKLYKKYLYIYPVMGKYHKIADNLLTLKYIFKEDPHIPSIYFQVLKRNGVSVTVPMPDYEKIQSADGLPGILKVKKTLLLVPSDSESDRDRHTLKYENDVYYIDDRRCTLNEMTEFVNDSDDTYIVTENFRVRRDGGKADTVIFIIENLTGYDPQIMGYYSKDNPQTYSYNQESNTIGQRPEIYEYLKTLARSLKELEFFGVELIIDDNEFKTVDIASLPFLPAAFFDNQKISEYIKSKYNAKKKNNTFKRRIFMLGKAIYSDMAKKRGYMGFMMKNWQRDILRDWMFKKTSFKEKIWCHRRGFFSYRIRQYGLTEENYRNFLSDRDYRKLRPINNQFVSWVYDKVITRYVLEGKKEYLPEYYYHLIQNENGLKILSLPDCKVSGKPGINDIIQLLKEKKKLVLKPSEGSHGEGFFKLEYKENYFYVNNCRKTEDDLSEFLKKIRVPYNITQYLENNKFLKEIYSETTFTVRIMVINDKITKPWIANAYLRIATKKTGLTDNVGDGGICARIDIETGKIFEPEKIEDHIILPCPFHPDTAVPIEGEIPNWDKIKKGILELSGYICQLEYMGFDVVVTDDSFKILEINTHQDLHRYSNYGSRVHEYFMEKKEKQLDRR